MSDIELRMEVQIKDIIDGRNLMAPGDRIGWMDFRCHLEDCAFGDALLLL
ncbi:hypothetical protein PED39_06350 [Methanomassiliicoccales archaeon LGM-RCC1]|nr:hypothetical protein PED39_06350 [Methanomassiliicoccales archaeon LGM-RCC1]